MSATNIMVHCSRYDKSLDALRRYGVGVLSVLAAFGLRYALTPWLGEELPFMFFIAAALISAWYGGAVTGIISLLLGLFFAEYFLLWAPGALVLSRSVVVLHFVRYLFTASLGVILIEVLHRSRHRLQKAEAQLRAHAAELENRVNERTASLTASVKSLEDILYHIAHNLRAPLRALDGYSEILINDYAADLDESGKRYLSRISEASTRMDGLIADLLSYGRLTHAPVDLRKVSTEHAIQKALSQLELQIRSRKAVIKTGPLDSVQADPGILNLVLLNLLENAIKFTATDVVPCVQIGTERRGAVVRLCVKDNGIGIAPQYHERIFGAFERLNQSETEGTGIGLAVVKHAVERMGGRVGIESHPGQGSMFWIELPSA